MSLQEMLGHYHAAPIQAQAGDFYVSPQGNDENDGSFERPFRTFARAQAAVREAKKDRELTVCVRAGEYFVKEVAFGPEDSGTPENRVVWRAYGDGDVVLNGGVALRAEDFHPIPDEIRERLHGDAREKTLCVDLKTYGLTKADWGELSPIGMFGSEDKYDNVCREPNCELFFDGERMTLSRYPNAGENLQLDDVADVGDCFEFPAQNYYTEWNDRRNHFGGRYIMDKATAKRVAGWKRQDGVWAYGRFHYDWADMSTPVRVFDTAHRTFFPAFVSRYGARKGGAYYFYNVLDELDAPGEWYLDRETGMLYFYPPRDLRGARVEMTITTKSVLHLKNAHDLTFEGFTFRGTRGDAVTIEGDRNVLRRFVISGVMGNGVVVNGRDNLVCEGEISHVGRGGIRLDGGDRETLTPGNNRADNNLIHDWAEVYRVYNVAVHLEGVGNICSHNEIYNAPHAAIFYYGNDHVVEYNHIHDVVKTSTDAGAIYSGQDWTRQGCVIRYNCLYNIGEGDNRPDGIYFDDMLSGQTAYGNLIVRAKKYGFLIGGGRDIHVYNNVIIDCGKAITYDDRGYDGLFHDGWARHAVVEGGCMWERLAASPYQTEIWKKHYPSLGRVSSDFSNPHDPNFAVNPANSHVHDNLIVDETGLVGRFDEGVRRYSTIENNFAYKSMQEAGFIADTYTLAPDAQAHKDMPAFTDLPLNQMGRY